MDERKKQIIQGYNEIYNKVNAVKLYINIFKTYNEKLKKEFARANLAAKESKKALSTPRSSRYAPARCPRPAP